MAGASVSSKPGERRSAITRKLLSLIFKIVLLACLAPFANAQITGDAARELALSTVRSKKHIAPDQFLSIHREEELEESLANVTTGWRRGPELIYTISQTGAEIKENSIAWHTVTDGDPTYIVAVNSTDRAAYCIHGCGLRESLAEFQSLIAAMKVRLGSPDQAQSLVDFYREVNPQNYEALAPIMSLLEFKQAAERECHAGVKSFDAGEAAFNAWWKRAEPLYRAVSFAPDAVAHGDGYQVEWFVTSSSSIKSCGGALLQAQLEVGADGRVGKLTFSSAVDR